MRYDEIYASLAERAVETGRVNLLAFIRRSAAIGLSVERIEQLLLQDLASGGPIFGSLFRSIESAAVASTTAAMNQGQALGELATLDREIMKFTAPGRQFTDLKGIKLQDIEMDTDPETMEDLETLDNALPKVWIAELKNTCHRCLPLHGRVLTSGQWKALGFDPITMHDGWRSDCKCTLELTNKKPGEIGRERQDGRSIRDLAVLVRKRDGKGVRGGRKTVRALADNDIERAQNAVAEALKSAQGQIILADLGSANAGFF